MLTIRFNINWMFSIFLSPIVASHLITKIHIGSKWHRDRDVWGIYVAHRTPVQFSDIVSSATAKQKSPNFSYFSNI